MRTLLLSLLLVLPLSADETAFDEGRFTVEFPDGWKKADPPQANIVVHRETEDGEATFSISRLGITPGAKADLDATLDTFVKNFKDNGMTVKGDPKGQASVIDGKPALVAAVPVEMRVDDEPVAITFFMVFVEASERLIVMQATLRGSGTDAQRGDCRKIIGSFEEHEVKKKDEETKEDAEQKKE